GDSLKADDYKQKAKDVMDRVVEVMPYELFPMNYFDIDFAEAFYSIGDSIKGDEALLEIARVSHQELDFFFYTLNDKQVNKVVIEIQMAMATISRVINATIRNEREEIYMELMQKFEAYNNAFDRLRI
ncbi:MAG: hypothetical protein GX879_10715, partial [Bacteroidales bacterium]|nr:hypothetical protein [Bacteroidales bacterium]